jgi:hypothetical protein
MIKSRRIRWERHVTHMRRNTYKILVEKCEGERPLGGPKREWYDSIRWILRKYGGKV